ncbi:MAG: DUF2786 domain-containing protein [Acidimicrobiales bacterium]
MGVNNRQRRRQKHEKHARERRASGPRFEGPARWERELRGAPAELVVDALIDQAAEDLFLGTRLDAEPAIDQLERGVPPNGSRRMVARRLGDALEGASTALASQRWLPAEVTRVVRRRLGRPHETAVAASIGGGWERFAPQLDPEWAAEAAAMGTRGWTLDPAVSSWASNVHVALEVLGLIRYLPTLPPRSGSAIPRPSESRSSRDERVLVKVRHLLSKAESTSFAEEADALTAKAQELLTRYSLDRAAAEAAGGSPRTTASVHRMWIDDPYVVAKAQLLHIVALANRCRSVLTEWIGLATVVGDDDDIDAVELLFTSLLVQATTQMTAAGSKTDRFGRSRTRSFRQSFLVAFAVRIGQRLREADERSVNEAAREHGQSLLPVLAARDDSAQETIDELFPDTVKRGSSVTDHEGWVAGTVAADMARLFVHPELAGEIA